MDTIDTKESGLLGSYTRRIRWFSGTPELDFFSSNRYRPHYCHAGKGSLEGCQVSVEAVENVQQFLVVSVWSEGSKLDVCLDEVLGSGV